MGHTVIYFPKQHKLLFKIGFSKKKIYFLPPFIKIIEAHKYYLRLGAKNKTALTNTCLNIQKIKYPHDYKILGLYLDRQFGKPKPIIKKK